MTLQTVVSALTPDDQVYVPTGDAGFYPGDRGSSIRIVYTRKQLVPTGHADAVRAADFAELLPPRDSVVIDPPGGGGPGVIRSRTPAEPVGLVFWFDQYVPTAADTATAQLNKVPTEPTVVSDPTDQVLRRVVSSVPGARLFAARWPPSLTGNASDREPVASIVLAPSGAVATIIDGLRAGFDLTPHAPVLVGEKSDFPWSTRIRMR